ncbi:ArsR family transcriptional regulator [Halobacteria archaeon AArc-m2/3/4]|uniref:ArsR family transcriptional regulator n=1 Tax=Natronoglomus mannanivorans TaxID=2979990 RepID=A0ABT2Q8K1_9EURY|nr:ArsR family transcriptional regulator [Halobacteria archaeon AArc-m2/3/4]
MDDDVDATLLSVLTRRKPLLERLATHPTRKCDLASELDVSRSTIDRGIRDLEQLDLIERDGREYRTTLAGELALTEYDRFSHRVSNVVDARAVLSSLPPETTIDPTFLEGADVVVSQRPDPQRPARELERLAQSTDYHRGFGSAFLAHLVAVYRDAIVDGLDCEFVVTSDVLDRLVSRHHEPVSEALSTGRIELREASESASLPYCLIVSRGETTAVATVLVYVDEGLKGIITNNDPAAVAWAESILEEIWAAATPISFDGE